MTALTDRVTSLRGQYAGKDWNLEVVMAEPACHLCEKPATPENPFVAFVLHSGSPLCQACVTKGVREAHRKARERARTRRP